jgi:hypothetical protein
MPRIIDYDHVLATLTSRGMKSLYHNSGSFGFPIESFACGWIGQDDPTILESVRARCTQVPGPHAENLARLFDRAWTTLLPGTLWIMPGSHWAYELDFGSAEWMPDALRAIQIDPTALQPRNVAAAIEFDLSESGDARTFIAQLLTHLTASDFTAALPNQAAICTIHHHAQLWWQTPDVRLRDLLMRLPDDELR